MFDHPFVEFSTPRPRTWLTGVYTVDPAASTVGFAVRHGLVTHVRGRFTAFEGLLTLDGSQPTRSQAHLGVRTGSIDTGLAARDAQLTGPRLLDAAAHPLMAFRSTGIADAGDDLYRVSGLLRIKDVERPVRLEVVFVGASRTSAGQTRVGFEGSATLHRSDWSRDLAAGEPDSVRLSLDIAAVRRPSAETA